MNNQQLWQSVLGNMEVSLSRGNFTTWFKNTAVVERSDETIIIGVPSEFIRKWISEKFQQEILKILKQIAPEIREIKYQVGQNKVSAVTASLAAANSSGKNTAANNNATAYKEPAGSGAYDGLNPKYTFDTFVIGKNSELAHAASVAVATVHLWGGRFR
jgi:chromosomal replication initiator protein